MEPSELGPPNVPSVDVDASDASGDEDQTVEYPMGYLIKKESASKEGGVDDFDKIIEKYHRKLMMAAHDDGNQTEESPIDHPNIGQLDTGILPLEGMSKTELANWVTELLNSQPRDSEFPDDCLSFLFSMYTWSEWRPTRRQKIILKLLEKCKLHTYDHGRIESIVKQLSEYGHIDYTDVRGWFYGFKPDMRQEQTSSNLIPTSSEGSKSDDGTQWRLRSEHQRILEFFYPCGLSNTTQPIEQIMEYLSKFGKIEVADVNLWLQDRAIKAEKKQEQKSSSLTNTEGLKVRESESNTRKRVWESIQKDESLFSLLRNTSIEPDLPKARSGESWEMSTYRRIRERSEAKAISDKEKSEKGKVVSMSSEISSPVNQEQDGSDNSRYDNTGKLLPINIEKQRELIPTVEENSEVWATGIWHRNRIAYSEDSVAHITGQPDTSSATVSTSTPGEEARPESSTPGGEETRPEEQNNTKIGDPKKGRQFSLFSWWQKK